MSRIQSSDRSGCTERLIDMTSINRRAFVQKFVYAAEHQKRSDPVF